MGREVKRVALDFDWPMDKVWDGYVNSHYVPCEACHGQRSVDGEWLDTIINLLLLAGGNRTHPWLARLPLAPSGAPTHEMTRLTSGLAGREPSVFGHDAIDRYETTRKIIKAAGMPDDWGTCKQCDGSGIAPEAEKAYTEWTPTEPPEGDGWQLWETVSEGRPSRLCSLRPRI